MNLLSHLCKGRNKASVAALRDLHHYFSQDMLLNAIMSPKVDARLRAAFADLFATVYIDTGMNAPFLARPRLVYDVKNVDSELDTGEPNRPLSDNPSVLGETLFFFSPLAAFVVTHLDKALEVRSSAAHRFTAALLRVTEQLAIFGYYKTTDDIRALVAVLVKFLDNRENKEIPSA